VWIIQRNAKIRREIGFNSANGGPLQVRWNSRIGKCLYEFTTKLTGLSIILRISPGGNKLINDLRD
jgi:hypothetical protein